ncbi:MAG: bifunctional oligoribonuclease/PAP phosphatase NrnA [bacterium]
MFSINANTNIETFIQLVENKTNIVIAGHINSDGDCMGSAFSLGYALTMLGKKNVNILLNNLSDTYDYIIEMFKNSSNPEAQNMIYDGDISELNPDLFIAVDCADIRRLGHFKEVFDRATTTINIDHHISNVNFADLNIVQPATSSTSEVVFEILNQIGCFNQEIATAIYSGIVSDTAGFKHNCTGPRTHEIAGKLISMGTEVSEIHSKLLYTHTFANARILAKTIDNLDEFQEGCIISTLTKNEILEDCKASYEDLEGISAYLADFQDIGVSVLMYERANGDIKISFRSRELDVNELASKFGGGGHKLASGATIENGNLEDLKAKVITRVKIALENLEYSKSIEN